jgi:hypothetical protein
MTPEDIYDKQLKAINTIKDTKGYEEIKSYFERSLKTAKDLYATVKPEDLHRLQERDIVITGFLDFLNNLESAKKIESQAKVSN